MKEIRHGAADADRGRAYFRQLMTLAACLRCSPIVIWPKPFIACGAGRAIACRLQLGQAAISAICERCRKFATPGVNIGLFLSSTPECALLAATSRRESAMEMLLTET